MPELPEVETTTRGLQKEIVGLKIKDVWTDLNSKDQRQKDAVKNPKYFIYFKKEVIGKKILSVERRAKNILINLSAPTPSASGHSPSGRGRKSTILIHMKMTGCLFYQKQKTGRFIHVIFTLSNGYYLAFSDVRKFGKITLLDTETRHNTKHLENIGPEPLDKTFTWQKLKERLILKPNGKIKTVLMNPSILAGIGNIYSDEILWRVGLHPETLIKNIPQKKFLEIFSATQELLKKGINFGGDSMSDYLNIYGQKGSFQLHHEAYRRTGEKCRKKGCSGDIIRKIVNGRSAHFCNYHQINL